MLVDCGLFQGLKELRERNWQPLPVEPTSLDAVVAHARAHRPHGLPAAPGQGRASGAAIFCTPGTADLCRIMLPDCGPAGRRRRARGQPQGYTKHAPALPLFTEEDAFQRADAPAAGRLRPPHAGRRRPSRWRSSTRATCSARRSRASASRATAAARSCSAATSAATTGRCCPIRRAVETADVLLRRVHLRRSRRTSRTTTARGCRASSRRRSRAAAR